MTTGGRFRMLAVFTLVLAAGRLSAAPDLRGLPCTAYRTVESAAAGALPLPHGGATAAQAGPLLYVGGYFNGFMVIDVATAAQPQLVADVDHGLYRLNNPTWVELGSGVAFLGGGYGEIPVFDLADPAAPALLAEITLPFEVMATAYGDGHLFAATYGRRSFAGVDTSAFNIFDVGDPAAPVATAWIIDNHSWAYSMAYREGVVFLGASSGLHTFDVTDPTTAVELDVIDLGAPVTGMEFVGNELHAVDLFGTLHLVDASDPAALVSVTAVDLRTSKGEGLYTKDTLTYAACGAAGLVVADLTRPADPAAAWPTAAACRGVGPTGDGGIWALSGSTLLGTLQAPPDPVPAGARVDLGFLPSAAVLDGDRLYVVDGDLTILDVSDPRAPVVLGVHEDANSYWNLAVNGATVYLGSSSAGVVAVDVSDPAATTIEGLITSEPTYSLVARGARVFVGPRDGALQIIDATDPKAPVVLGTYPGTGPYRTYAMDFLGDRLVMLAGATIEILDVADPAAIVPITSLQTGAGLDVAVWGDLVLAAAASTIKILEFTSAATLVTRSERDLPGMIYDLAVADGAVYAACRQGGVHVYAIDEPTILPLLADPGAPELIAVLPGHDEVRCVAVGDALIAVAGNPYLETTGYAELCGPICRISAAEIPPVPPSPSLTASPNPFNPRVELGFTLPAPRRVALVIHDLAGRRVRTLVDGVLAAGPHSVVWDGHDARGVEVASGSYIARLESGPIRTSCKIALVR